MTTLWGIHNDAIPAIRLLNEGFISIGWAEVGDLARVRDQGRKEQFRRLVEEAIPGQKPGTYAAWAGVLRRFGFVMQPGDLVAAPDRETRTINIGRVTGPYVYLPDEPAHPHHRSVEWLIRGVPRSSFSQPALNVLGSALTLFEIRNHAGEFLAVVADAGFDTGALVHPEFKTKGYRLVAAALDGVGSGRWTTYGDLAEVAGLIPGQVGQFLAEVPHEAGHRVIRFDGTTYEEYPHLLAGTTQRQVLESERVTFDREGRADPTRRVTIGDLREALEAADVLEPTARRAWLVRGNNVNGQDLVPAWLKERVVTLPASSLREVEPGIGREELKAIVDEDYAHASYAAKGEKLDEFHMFLTRMDAGHIVVTVDQGKLYVGEITGEPTHGDDAMLSRPVDWLEAGAEIGSLPAELKSRLKVQRDVLDLTQQLDSLEALLAARTPVASAPSEPVVLPDPTPELAEKLHVGLDWLQEVIDLLNDRPQLIFYGPPGTGKTYLAQAIAEHAAGDNFRLVQFHPAYSYEDFFEGYRPTSSGGFELKPGPMRRIVDQAVQNPSVPHVLIIDEINRGNLAKVFGELYFLLEYRESNVELLYGDGDFSLPPNVFIIGTMNTADRSIALVDAAMRRRFAFLPLHPSEPPTEGILRSWLKSTERPERVADLMDELNNRMDDPDFKIGPSYFMRPAVYESGGLERTWRTAILPLLEEHHFGEMTRAEIAARYGLESVAARVDQRNGADDAAPAAD